MNKTHREQVITGDSTNAPVRLSKADVRLAVSRYSAAPGRIIVAAHTAIRPGNPAGLKASTMMVARAAAAQRDRTVGNNGCNLGELK
jgi:hypothetical protein